MGATTCSNLMGRALMTWSMKTSTVFMTWTLALKISRGPPPYSAAKNTSVTIGAMGVMMSARSHESLKYQARGGASSDEILASILKLEVLVSVSAPSPLTRLAVECGGSSSRDEFSVFFLSTNRRKKTTFFKQEKRVGFEGMLHVSSILITIVTFG